MIHNESGVYILKNCRCAVSWFSGAILSNIRDNNPLLRHLGTLKSKITHIYIIVRVWQTSICKEGADDFIGNPLHTLPLYRNEYEFWELSLSAQNHENFHFLVLLWLQRFLVLGDSHVAGKKYWIISQVVEVIMSKSNEIYQEWPEATSDKFHYFYMWLPQPRVILYNTFCQLLGNNIPKIVDIEP